MQSQPCNILDLGKSNFFEGDTYLWAGAGMWNLTFDYQKMFKTTMFYWKGNAQSKHYCNTCIRLNSSQVPRIYQTRCKKIISLAQLRYPKYITYLNKIPHVYQVCLMSCTTGIWRSPQVRLNLVTSKPHETWASQVHAIHSQVNSKCTKYKLLSTITISFASQNISTFVFHIHGWFLKILPQRKKAAPL